MKFGLGLAVQHHPDDDQAARFREHLEQVRLARAVGFSTVWASQHTPFSVGLLTFFTGPATILGEPMHKGHSLAVEEINARGGLLGKRRIEILKADENAGTDANVRRR